MIGFILRYYGWNATLLAIVAIFCNRASIHFWLMGKHQISLKVGE